MSTIATKTNLSSKSLRLGLITVVALMVASIGAGASFEARNHSLATSPTGLQTDPFQMMVGRTDLGAQQLADLSVVFN